RSDMAAREKFIQHRDDFGYAQLLLPFASNPLEADDEAIRKAAWSTVPSVPAAFFTFRFMVLASLILLVVFALSAYFTTREQAPPRWLLLAAIGALPVPWLAAELGWFLAEYGRQPWVIEGVLPTFQAASNLTLVDLVVTIVGFTFVYGALAVIEVKLMIAAINRGPGLIEDLGDLVPGLAAGGTPAAKPSLAE
ncbi:MAG: cytochrome ubiquinol oxidase subunit I, partial [Pseudomonadota bacterium]